MGTWLTALGLLFASRVHAEAPLTNTQRIMVVVAHQDDDIMVTVPDLVSAIRGGRAVRTVYVTSGDAGFTCNAYTQGRELGAKAQQALLANVPNRWVDEERSLNGKRVRFSRLENTQVSMAFIGLPNPGFLSVDPPEAALMRLWLKQINSVRTLPLDGRSSIDTYTREDLIEELKALMTDFNAQDLRILDASQQQLPIYPFEHVDHQAAALFATAAFQRYTRADALTFYPLYSVTLKAPNQTEATANLRRAMFNVYRQYDPKPCDTVTTSVCGTTTSCDPLAIYDPFWTRSYPEDTLRRAAAGIRTPSGGCVEASGSSLLVAACDASRAAQKFTLERGGIVRSDANGMCMYAANGNAGTLVTLRACARTPAQQFFLTTQKQVRGPEATCVREWFGQFTLADCGVDALALGYQFR